MATALRGKDPDRVMRAARWLVMVGEFRLTDALDVCVFLSKHEPASHRGSRARARLVARLATELRIGLDHFDQLFTWAEVLPDPQAIYGLRRVCEEVDRARRRAADARAAPP
ncbi:MAG: hypothetical protein F2817_01865 [Actinobacteria bacterium]|nr:hypothetical protein [Actinomycetota bacterium]